MNFETFLNKDFYLCEQPQVIGDENWNLDSGFSNEQLKKRLMKGSSDHLEDLGEFNGLKLYRYRKEVFAIDESSSKKIAYWIQFTVDHDKDLDEKIVTQRALWRDIDNASSVKIASHVFFEVLLPIYKTIASDKLQTKDGKKFWFYRVDEAFDKGLNVYWYDETSTPKKLEKILSKQEFKKMALSGNIWGDVKDFQKKRILIATKRLHSTSSNVEVID